MPVLPGAGALMIVTRRINLDTNVPSHGYFVSVINITPQVQKIIGEVYIANGIVALFVPATTAAIATIEFEPGLVTDFQKTWERLVPKELIYQHKFQWEENNGFSHIRASLQGQSLVVPIANRRLTLGQFQQVVAVEFDNRARTRQIILQFMGEAG
jgi:secondary thiamine-phosphate synthase enzyme